MSALGHKQTYAVQQPMSALPPIATAKADIRKRSCIRFTPESGHGQRNSLCPLWANSGHRDDHSIASSVTDSSDGGTVRSSVFAVLRLMANSKVTVCWERPTIMKGT